MTSNPGAAASGAPSVSPVADPVVAEPEVAEPVEASVGEPAAAESVDACAAHPDRQPVVRVRGSRRARLLAAPGTTAEPAPADDPARGAGARPTASGPNDERMLREVPPHY